MAFSSNSITVGVLLLVFFGGLVRILLQGLRNPLNKVPGPWYARWTNLPLKMAVMAGRRVHYVHALHEKYGPYVRLSPNEVSVNDAGGFKQIHAISSGFAKNQWYQDLTTMERPGIFAMNDKKAHAARRKLFARPFSKTHLREHWEGAVREKVELAVSRMQEEARSTGMTDVLKWWTFMATDISSHLMFGDSFRTLEKGEVNDYIRCLQKALMGGGIGAELPLVRQIGRWLPLRASRELFGSNDYLIEYGQAAVNNMKAQKGSKNIFANMMVEAEKGERLDDTDVKLEAMGLIVAGTDTTAISLTYLVWAVLSHPAVEKELKAELATLPENYMEADLEALPFLNAVIEETLRLYGAAPGMLPRAVPPNGANLGGYFLPPGTTATTQSYSLHRDPKLFRDPETWLGKDEGYRINDTAKSVFSPMGAGSRICLGIHLAYMELRLGAAEFFRQNQDYALAPSATAECMEQENYFLIAPAGHKCEITLKK